MKIVIGLGNPGEKYKCTRHNTGFMLIDRIVDKKGLAWSKKSPWLCTIAQDSGTIYAKPDTYMNDSGQAAVRILAYYKLLPKKFGLITAKDQDLSACLSVLHDELDLPLGKYRLSEDSRSAGHRGVESMIACLKTKNFRRLRIGIMGEKPEQLPARDYVLSRFSAEEKKQLDKLFDEIAEKSLI